MPFALVSVGEYCGADADDEYSVRTITSKLNVQCEDAPNEEDVYPDDDCHNEELGDNTKLISLWSTLYTELNCHTVLSNTMSPVS